MSLTSMDWNNDESRARRLRINSDLRQLKEAPSTMLDGTGPDNTFNPAEKISDIISNN